MTEVPLIKKMDEDEKIGNNATTVGKAKLIVNATGQNLFRQEQTANCQPSCGEIEKSSGEDVRDGDLIDKDNLIIVFEDTNSSSLESDPSEGPKRPELVSWMVKQLRKLCLWLFKFIFVSLLNYLMDYFAL